MIEPYPGSVSYYDWILSWFCYLLWLNPILVLFYPDWILSWFWYSSWLNPILVLLFMMSEPYPGSVIYHGEFYPGSVIYHDRILSWFSYLSFIFTLIYLILETCQLMHMGENVLVLVIFGTCDVMYNCPFLYCHLLYMIIYLPVHNVTNNSLNNRVCTWIKTHWELTAIL